ncbi:Calcium uniporter protein 2, mitochondrial, partial [Cucurbita argyrosperma subsp. argyrosperma]
MASTKTLARRLFNASNRLFYNTSANKLPLDPGDHGIFRRFLHQRPNFSPPSTFTRSLPSLPIGFGNAMEHLVSRDRILLDGLKPPAPAPGELDGLTVEETRKLVRLAEVVRMKRKLKEIPTSRITYREFVRICGEDNSDGDEDYGVELAKRLDESGAVIILGNVVFLHPEQIAKSIGCLIPTLGMNSEDPISKKELEELEKEKAMIDGKAGRQVRRELRWGLGFLVAQTAALMRLTFWELSWDVMEPICYFITSTYFMGGYAFFLTTSKEPSFEGLYQSRFVAKQKNLMKLHNFDVHKYNRLRSDSNPQIA